MLEQGGNVCAVKSVVRNNEWDEMKTFAKNEVIIKSYHIRCFVD